MATEEKNDTPALGEYNYSKRQSREFETSKYDFAQYSYPEDIWSSRYEYGGNYVVFYINVAEDSRLIKDNPESTVSISADERYSSEFTRLGMTGASAVAAATGATLAAGTVLKAIARESIDFKEVGAASVAAGAATGIVAAAAGGKMARQTKRLKTAIAMHVPNQLSVRYSTNWQEEEMGLMMAGASITEGAIKAFSEGNVSNLSAPAASAITSAALNAPGTGNFASAASGLAANPKKEQLFKGVDFRSFQMEYSFFPRTSTEAQNVLKIIKQFKYHMHPEFKDAASFIYIYPSEFDIYYYNYTQENKALHRHTSCVLTEMNVNYTPNGNFTTFPDGMPTQMNMQLTFKELAILTKDQIEDGF